MPVLLGTGEGVYALSHAFFHDYGITPLILTDREDALLSVSFCAYIRCAPYHKNEGILLHTLDELYVSTRGKSLLLIPTDGESLALIKRNLRFFETRFLLPHMPSECTEETSPSVRSRARATVLLYLSGHGEVRTVYATVRARSASGEPIVLLTESIPTEVSLRTERLASTLSRGVYIFYEDEGGTLYRESAVLPKLLALSAAKDASIPEWMIEETVLAAPLSAVDEDLCGVYTPLPYRKMRSLLDKKTRRALRRLPKCSLLSYKEEGVRREIARAMKTLLLSYKK